MNLRSLCCFLGLSNVLGVLSIHRTSGSFGGMALRLRRFAVGLGGQAVRRLLLLLRRRVVDLPGRTDVGELGEARSEVAVPFIVYATGVWTRAAKF